MSLNLRSLWLPQRSKSERAEVRAQQIPRDERIWYNNRDTLAWKTAVCPIFSVIIVFFFHLYCFHFLGRWPWAFPELDLLQEKSRSKSLKWEEEEHTCALSREL